MKAVQLLAPSIQNLKSSSKCFRREAGRAWTAQAARTVQSQGGDLYGLGNNLLLKAAEYAAQYNLGYVVPYDRSFYRCEAILINGPWSQISPITRGIGVLNAAGKMSSPIWDMIYCQYVKKRGVKSKWVEAAKAKYDAAGGEGHQTIDDQPSWGNLLFAYDKKGSYQNDDDRTIWGGGTLGENGTGNYNNA